MMVLQKRTTAMIANSSPQLLLNRKKKLRSIRSTEEEQLLPHCAKPTPPNLNYDTYHTMEAAELPKMQDENWAQKLSLHGKA